MCFWDELRKDVEKMINLNPLFRGDSREYCLTFKDDQEASIDITGWKVYFTMKENEWDGDGNCAIKKDVTEHEAPQEGKTKFVLRPEDTNGLNPGEYVYDIQVKKPSGDVLTVAMGKITVKADVTRRTD